MIPMPPTSEQSRHGRRRARRRRGDLRLIAHGKVVAVVAQLVGRVHDRGDLILSRRDVAGRHRAGENLEDPHVPAQPGLRRGVRHENHVVLIVSRCVLSLGLKHAGHGERLPADLDR